VESVENTAMVEIRPATVADLPDIHRVWWATELDAQPSRVIKENPWFAHVLRTGSILIAIAGGGAVGFAGCRLVGDTKVISDCFVHPERQGQGIGTALLQQLLSKERPVMTLASGDPRARSLYARFGMVPLWECHYIEGAPRMLGSSALHIREIDSYPVPEADLPHLQSDLCCTFLEVGRIELGSTVAVTKRSVESSLVEPGADGALVLTSLMDWMASRGAAILELQLGERHPAFPVLIEAGFHVTGTDTLMASPGAGVPDQATLTFNGDLLLVGF